MGVGGVPLVAEHGVPGDVGGVPGDVQAMVINSVGHVIVLAPPPPELVAEPVERLEVLHTDGTHAPKNCLVR